ncbi:MAG: hypothetical protein AAFN70_10525, partial [Planctomycetota bacterium]
AVALGGSKKSLEIAQKGLEIADHIWDKTDRVERRLLLLGEVARQHQIAKQPAEASRYRNQIISEGSVAISELGSNSSIRHAICMAKYNQNVNGAVDLETQRRYIGEVIDDMQTVIYRDKLSVDHEIFSLSLINRAIKRITEGDSFGAVDDVRRGIESMQNSRQKLYLADARLIGLAARGRIDAEASMQKVLDGSLLENAGSKVYAYHFMSLIACRAAAATNDEQKRQAYLHHARTWHAAVGPNRDPDLQEMFDQLDAFAVLREPMSAE